MQVFSINCQAQKNNVTKRTSKNGMIASNQVTFEGALTRLAQKRPTVSAELLQAANGIFKRDNGFVGIFPPEFIRSIKKNLGEACSPQKIKESIKETKEAFAQVSKLLEQIEIETNKNIEKYTSELNFDKYIEEQKQKIQAVSSNDYEKNAKIYKKMKRQFLPDKNFIKEIEKQASNILERVFKKNKLIPIDAKIIVKRLEDGQFGTAYKIYFLDKSKKNIFKPKVLKYNKNSVNIDSARLKLGLRQFEIIKENYDKCLLLTTKFFDSLSSRETPEMKKYIDAYLFELNAFKNRTIEQQKEIFIEKLKKYRKESSNKHGITKEANTANYIRKALGNNLQNSTLITHYYSDLNNNYALLDLSNYGILGPVTKEIDYDSLGIIPEDIVMISKFTNFVDGRLIDYGGFKINNKILAENPIARRIYKKIKHISAGEPAEKTQKQIDRFNEIYEQASANKISQSSDVLLGLNEARKLIPIDKQNLLAN